MTAGSKNVVLLVLNMALSDGIIHAGGRAYNGIADAADGVCGGGKRLLGYEAPAE